MLNFPATHGKVLPVLLGYRLKSHGTVFSLGHLVEGRGHHRGVLFGLRRACIEIPHGNSLGLGQKLGFEFVESILPSDYERVRQIFRKRGAYGRFKDFLESRGLLDQWYDFENQRQKQALRRWSRENGIELSGLPEISAIPNRMVSTASAIVVRAGAETDIPAVAAIHQVAFPRQLDSTAWIECNFKAYPRIVYFVAEEKE